jgi:hypothetical protein
MCLHGVMISTGAALSVLYLLNLQIEMVDFVGENAVCAVSEWNQKQNTLFCFTVCFYICTTSPSPCLQMKHYIL